jgi:hypothetical protein
VRGPEACSAPSVSFMADPVRNGPGHLEPFIRNGISSTVSMSRLYVAQRIHVGLSGYSSSAGSALRLRRSLRARRKVSRWEA